MDRPTAVVVGVGAEQEIDGAVSRRFAAEGYHVLVAGRTQAKIDRVVKTIMERDALPRLQRFPIYDHGRSGAWP
jgi:NAD(P)-dependent dehydrogenase (short-subunit alcohol dehydrogenase family)